MAEVHVRGLAELQKALDTLAPRIEKNVMRGAMRAGMKPVLEAAKQGVPVRTGRLRSSLGISTRARGRVVSASVRSRDFIGKFVEFGTRAHLISAQEDAKPINWRRTAREGRIVRVSMRTINRAVLRIGNWFAKSVQHPGARPRPFLRPALDANAQAATAAAAQYIKQRLQDKHGIDTAHIAVEGDE